MMKPAKKSPLADVLAEPEESAFDMSQLAAIIRDHLWLIAVCGVLGFLAGYAYVLKLPRTFLATTVIEINAQQMRVVNFDALQPAGGAVSDMADAVVAGFKSRVFLSQVVEANKLTEDSEFLPPAPDGKPHPVDTAINVLNGITRVVARKGTPFIDVGVEHGDPKVAQRLADALVAGYVAQSFKRRAATSKMAIDFLESEATKLKDKLKESEEALQAYVEETKLSSLKEQQDTVVARLKTLSSQLVEAKSKRMRLEGDYEAARRLSGTPQSLLELASVADLPAVSTLKQRVSALETNIATLALRYTEKNPKMIQARLQLREAQAALDDALLRLPSLLQSTYESAVSTEKKFETAMEEQEKLAMELNRQAIPYNVLSRELDTNRALYESILKRLKETEIAKGVEQSNVSVFERAILPAEPIERNQKRTLALALVLGLSAGVGLSFGLSFLDTSLRNIEETEKLTRLSVLGAIPRQPALYAADNTLSLKENPASPAAEAFRSLRAALHVAGRAKGNRVILMTSSAPGEGKTFCAVNYAEAVAQQGLRTLLIDADLRQPMVEKVLLPGKRSLGLSDYLNGTSGEAPTIHPAEVGNLFVMPAGSPSSNPAELLSSVAFGALIRFLREDFDRIIIDTAPVMAVSDTLLLTEHADMVCLVIRAGKTPRNWVTRTLAMLEQAGSQPIGLLLNQIVLRPRRDYSLYRGNYASPALKSNGRHPAAATAKRESGLQSAAQKAD